MNGILLSYRLHIFAEFVKVITNLFARLERTMLSPSFKPLLGGDGGFGELGRILK